MSCGFLQAAKTMQTQSTAANTSIDRFARILRPVCNSAIRSQNRTKSTLSRGENPYEFTQNQKDLTRCGALPNEQLAKGPLHRPHNNYPYYCNQV
jgi:hypothetical protein